MTKKTYFFFGIAAARFDYDWIFNPDGYKVNIDSPWTRPWPTIGNSQPSVTVGERNEIRERPESNSD